MYEAFWKLKEKAFENTPNPHFMYYSKKHEEGLMRLLYAIKEEKGAAMLTGDYGSGKTILSRIVIDELIKNKVYEVALITHPQLTPVQFLHEITYQLKNEQVKGKKPEILHIMQDLVYNNARQGKKTVIIIDEAQIIRNKGTFEELRLLLNFQLNDSFLITLILIGQPELLKKVNAIPQLQQRLGIKYHLTGLDRNETEAYIKHRLSVAGNNEEVFSGDAVDEIYRYANGIPRKINNACDMCLLIGFGQEARFIDADLARKVVNDLNSGVISHATNV